MHYPFLLSCLAALLAVSGTVHAGGIDFTPHGTQPGLGVELAEPQVCEDCHGSRTTPDSSFIADATWSGSMMANATRDPLFWAALDVAERDVPGVGDWCLRCHSPVGWTKGRVSKNGLGGTVNGTNGCLLQGDHDDLDNGNNDYAGVTCHLCHRMTPTGPTGQVSPQKGSGDFWIDDQTSCDGYFGPCRYGPFTYAKDSPVSPPHGWRYSRFTTRSAQCGTCHDVSSPRVDGAPLRTLKVPGTGDTGRAFPAERTFTEWKQSRYGEALLVDSLEGDELASRSPSGNTECQDCHMRTSAETAARACLMNNAGSRRGELPVHEFVGGSVWPLRLLRGLYGSAGGLDRLEAFDRTIAWSLELLQQRSADVAVTLDAWAGAGSPLVVRVRVTNNAGHKLPTGYGEGRRMWLNVQVRDANDALVFESGAWNPATGTLASDPQLKVYEVLQGQWNGTTCVTEDGTGRKQFHFVLNDCIAKDNRIPPLGFRLYAGDDPQGLDVRPVGYSYPQTAPGSGILVNFDDTAYTVPTAGFVGPLRATATLQYQTASRDYIDFLRDQALENSQLSENAMCGRSWTVGPAGQSRGAFLHQKWSDPAFGRSPPVPMRSASAATP